MLRSSTSTSIGILLSVVAAGAIQACAPATTDVGAHEQQPPDTNPPAISTIVAAAHTCALTPAGAAYCWGYDVEQAGVDQFVLSPTLVVPPAGIAFQSLSVSKVEDVTCALATTGAAYCWGDNDHGQLGDGTTTPHSLPAPVAGGLTFKSIAVGDAHVCGVTTNGSAYCWGFSSNGAFGDNSVGEHLTPIAGAPGLAFQSVVAGSDFTCALTTTGTVDCWGLGNTGQLGDGTGHTSRIPVAVSGGLTFQSIVAGGLGACGLTVAGKAYCWGNDFFGTVGDGSSATEDGVIRRVAPTAVAGDLTFASLAAGYQTTCGLTESGAGYCWGSNDGAIGDGTLDRHSTPVAVAGGLTFRSISSGTGYSCGLATSNAVYCWGDNSDGALGDGTILSHPTPAPVRWPVDRSM
jgi:alpha-tubulin suppressor-like RCC1 family protein